MRWRIGTIFNVQQWTAAMTCVDVWWQLRRSATYGLLPLWLFIGGRCGAVEEVAAMEEGQQWYPQNGVFLDNLTNLGWWHSVLEDEWTFFKMSVVEWQQITRKCWSVFLMLCSLFDFHFFLRWSLSHHSGGVREVHTTLDGIFNSRVLLWFVIFTIPTQKG